MLKGKGSEYMFRKENEWYDETIIWRTLFWQLDWSKREISRWEIKEDQWINEGQNCSIDWKKENQSFRQCVAQISSVW